MDGERRRFRLSDAIILLIPTALSLALWRAGPTLLADPNRVGVPDRLLDWWWRSEFGLTLAGPGLAAFTVSLLGLRLRRPRPGRSRLGRQPGAVALLCGSAVLAVEAVGSAILLGLAGWPTLEDLLSEHSASMLQMPAAAVVGAWVSLVASGRWRPERSWIDRAGRVAGGAWAFVFFLAMALDYRAEVATFFPLSRWLTTQSARQVQLNEMTERHQDRERSRVARHDDLQALRKLFLSRQSAEQVRAIDGLLDQWRAREDREIAEEQSEFKAWRAPAQKFGQGP